MSKFKVGDHVRSNDFIGHIDMIDPERGLGRVAYRLEPSVTWHWEYELSHFVPPVVRRLYMTVVTNSGAAFAVYVPIGVPEEKLSKEMDALCDHVERNEPFSVDDTVRLLAVGSSPLPDTI